MVDLREHWNKIYETKSSHQMSWTEEIPTTSLSFVHSFKVAKNAAIIDVGGGESRFVDYLLALGYTNITVLDISEQALKKTQQRLGSLAMRVKWIVADVNEVSLPEKYDVWHDRATFHFLVSPYDITNYTNLAAENIKSGGFMTIGTFSESGPDMCSGLEAKRYSEEDLEQTLTRRFRKLGCRNEDHYTPSKALQRFLFCSFQKAA
ncbi:MAG TPA: class I SAM-dependent methyltransferase [Cyclobacteriaceae bacterium]|nr:class I SAM-dependent methyltransferase [Cyclobacteriaceae bacterium]